MPPTIYLIDGHALAYRTYFALMRSTSSGFTTSKGEPTAGVFGFTSVLLRILEQEKPEYLAVAFDTGKTFRDELYPEYKGTRAKMPDDLRPQIERIRQLVDALSIPRLEVEGYEADDVLGSVAHHLVEQGLGVKIITGDRDLLQLVDERIIVNLPGKSLSEARDYLPADVIEYLGVRPDQVVDYKALVGDKSDNIPGVTGIGEKTAITLLQTYNTLEGIYAHLDELSTGVRSKLEAGREQATLSRKLAQIVTDLPMKIDLEKARPQHFEPAAVEAIFRELEFRTLMTRLQTLMQNYGIAGQTKSVEPVKGQQLALFADEKPVIQISTPANTEIQTHIVNTPQALADLVRILENTDVISFDTETTSTDQMRADLVGISLATNGDQGYYIPLGHKAQSEAQLPIAVVLDALRGPLSDGRIRKIGHNVKYDFIVLARHGLRVEPLSFDTMIAEWLINPNSRNLGLKNLAWVRLDHRMTEIEELIGKGAKQISMADVPISQAAAYAAADAAVTLRLIPVLQEDMQRTQATQLFEEIEIPLVPVLADMEMAGIALDIVYLEGMSHELSQRMHEFESQIYTVSGGSFNINSTQQLSEVLFDRLKIPPPDRTQKTSSGFYSTAAGVLESLSGKHPVVDLVLDYRELSKLKSTYVDALPAQVNPITGRVHTSYNQTGSVTGRIASSEPNLQNIPIRTEMGRQVRRGFIASPGNQLLSVDYSQVELRIVAHMANDQAMLDTFHAGQDIHTTTAAAIYGISLDAVTKEQRRHAKAINFGLIYGMSAFGLTRSTELTLAEAEDFMDAYFRQFPAIKIYLDNMRRTAAEQGFVETLLGRRRYFPGLKDQSNRNIRNREEREAINAPIQGTAADIMKIAMLHVPSAISQAGLSARMLLQVHDELVLECPQSEIAPTAALVKQVMSDAYTLSIPLATEARQGPNWSEMTPVD
ncbi:MAG: DNA polymerase I [Chloroflexi bacterium RBG_16_52_11]|nr:MAG: DNA polymerase I [Chloroflexi bacterium RBG_16_52_11]